MEGKVVSKALCLGIVSVTLAAGVASAQTPPSEAEQVKTRQRISMMEGVLERAVRNGAENLLRQVRTVMPDVPMLTGVPQARGFKLDGYGVFFDVEVPALRLPLTWTLRYMLDDRVTANSALEELRLFVAEQQTARERERLNGLVKRLEDSVASQQVPARSFDPAVASDPYDAYTRAVKEALMDAMIENSGGVTVGAEEWLTVAARDNLPSDPLIPGDAAELNTIIFRIKGADLMAFRSGKTTLEETRKRVDVTDH